MNIAKTPKPQYIIAYTGILQMGYVKVVLFPLKQKEKRLDYLNEGISFATKFNFKWLASLYCKVLQKASDINYEFRTFKIVEI